MTCAHVPAAQPRCADAAQELEEGEYESTKEETLNQLAEMNASLTKLLAGDTTLVDHLGSVQLAIAAAISSAFQTPEVIKLFALREPAQLRQRLEQVQRDRKLGKLAKEAATQQLIEILAALQRLGDALSAEELAFLEENLLEGSALASFTVASDAEVRAR